MDDKYKIKEKNFTILIIAALFVAAFPSQSFAANTLGDIIQGAGVDIVHPVMYLIVALSYLLGFALVASALLRLKDMSERGGDGAILDAGLRFLGGALLVALPDAFGSGLYTFYASANGYQGNIGTHTPISPNTCVSFGGGGSSVPLECVAKNFALNVVPVFTEVIFILFYVFGAVMVVHSIYTLAMSHSTGQRNFPKGWMARFVIGILICNVPHLMNLIETTLGINGGGTITDSGIVDPGSSLLAYSPPSGLGVLATYGTLIQYVFMIFIMFGVIAVWRGIIHLKAFADGTQQGTLGSGMTHIIGGVLLANAKFTTCIFINTIFGATTGAALGFC